VVESAGVRDIFKDPRHPYTIGLLSSMPSLSHKGGRLNTIEGSVPKPTELPEGCRFSPRCRFAREICKKNQPPLKEIGERMLSCWMETEDYRGEEGA